MQYLDTLDREDTDDFNPQLSQALFNVKSDHDSSAEKEQTFCKFWKEIVVVLLVVLLIAGIIVLIVKVT